jgi:hypothetical protein
MTPPLSRSLRVHGFTAGLQLTRGPIWVLAESAAGVVEVHAVAAKVSSVINVRGAAANDDFAHHSVFDGPDVSCRRLQTGIVEGWTLHDRRQS